MKPTEANRAGAAPGSGMRAAGEDRRSGRTDTSRSPSLEARLLRRLLRSMGNPAFRVTLWNGEQVGDDPNPLLPHLIIHSRSALYRILLDPALYFGDAYSAGEVEVEGSLVDFLESAYRGEARSRRLRQRAHGRSYDKRNNPSRSRDNVYHHYDIGNAFYRLWLDEQLLYTCAYFPEPDLILEQAQIAKMDHVCRKLRLQRGESVIEAGCGWGALALHMARRYGVQVRAFNLSREQVAFARERAAAEGLDGQVEFVEDDYRNIDGPCDAFVSVGMLEHVGPDHYRDLGGVMHRCLGERGRGLIHTIGRNRAMPMNPWIEKRIFPGAYPPSLREMMEIFEPWEFSVLDVENLRLHYARTLEHWLARFERSVDQVRAMFDERFVRTWRLYLSGSIAGFTTGQMQLFQVLFASPENNDVPSTRAHLYLES
jgi:cyclopropane-fatty-acyl-phospholipid synthase